MFLIVGLIYERRHTKEIAQFGGLAHVMPVYATFTLIIFLASMGLPLLNGFVGEFMILQGAFAANRVWAYWAVSGVVLGAAYLLWLYQRVFWGKLTHEENQKLVDLNARELATLVPLVVLCFWIGVYPKPFLEFLHQPAARIAAIVQPAKFGEQAVHAATASTPREPDQRRLTPLVSSSVRAGSRKDRSVRARRLAATPPTPRKLRGTTQKDRRISSESQRTSPKSEVPPRQRQQKLRGTSLATVTFYGFARPASRLAYPLRGRKLMKWLGCLGVLVIVALVVGGVVIGGYNSLVGLSQGVDAQWAQVENQYQRRADLIPNLVETVKGAADFEKSTLEAVVQARASVGQVNLGNLPNDPAAFARFQQAQDGLSSALSRLMVVVERYPELKANQNFRDLQVALEGTENRVAVERNRYNEAAQAYNTARLKFPTVLFANLIGMREKAYFKAAAGSEQAPSVKFNFGASPSPAPAEQR